MKLITTLTAVVITSSSLGQAGTLDSSFGVNGKVLTDFNQGRDVARGIVTQSDGKIVVGGSTTVGDHYDFAVARYTTNGSLDSSFGLKGKMTTDFNGFDDGANCVAVDPKGRIVLAGYTVTFSGGESDFALVRYKPSGKLDSSFGTNGKVKTDFSLMFDPRQEEVNSILIQPDGKIVCIGYSQGAFTGFALARYKTNGNLDSTFGTNGKVITDVLGNNGYAIGYSSILQADGKIIVTGTINASNNYDFAIARYKANGTLDSTFGTNGKTATDLGSLQDIGYSVGLQSNGKIIVSGTTSPSGFGEIAVVRYNGSGVLDQTFGFGGKTTIALGSTSSGSATAIQADDKILVAGVSNSYDNFLGDFGVTRYKVDGNLDSTFGINGKVITDFGGDESASAISLQSSGKIAVAGYSYVTGIGYDFAVANYKGDEPVAIDIKKNIAALEGNSGTTPVTFKIVLNKTSTQTIKVNYTTLDGTAKAGSDYIATSGTLTFKPGRLSKSVAVNVIGDNVVEPNEKFTLQLSNPQNAILGTSSATCTIKNDDVGLLAESSDASSVNNTSIKLYPNPTRNAITIAGLKSSANTITIIDAKGQTVYSTVTGNNSCTIDVKSLAKGLYYVRINDESTLKFVKE